MYSVDHVILQGLPEKWAELGIGDFKTPGQGSAMILRHAMDPGISEPKEQKKGEVIKVVIIIRKSRSNGVGKRLGT